MLVRALILIVCLILLCVPMEARPLDDALAEVLDASAG